MRLLGLDPGLRRTGWGIIAVGDSQIRHIAHGVVVAPASGSLALRLTALFEGLSAVIAAHAPDSAAVEESFVNKNPSSTLKLGQARGVCLLAPALAGLEVAEYTPNLIKKSIVGTGHAQKQQVAMMVRTLLPRAEIADGDAADALAVAICHAHHAQNARRLAGAVG